VVLVVTKAVFVRGVSAVMYKKYKLFFNVPTCLKLAKCSCWNHSGNRYTDHKVVVFLDCTSCLLSEIEEQE